jgi:putative ABC transport system permease protein
MNFFKLTWRGLVKNKAYSFLNIFGLATGIACAALIFLWVEDEVSFDNVNTKKSRLYIARENQQYDTYVFTESSTPGMMGPALKAEIPGIANTCRASEGQTFLLFAAGDRSVFAAGKYA